MRAQVGGRARRRGVPLAAGVARAASRRRGRRSAGPSSPGRPPPPGTGLAARPSAVTDERGGHAELGVAAEHRHAVGARRPRAGRRGPGGRTTRRGRRRRRAGPPGAAPIAARSLTLTSTAHQPAHSGSRSTIAGRIASHAATRSLPGTGAPSSPTKPAPPGRRLAEQRRRAGALVAATRPAKRADRPAHAHVRAAARADRSRSRCQPRRAKNASLSAWTSASKRSTPAASARAHAARTSAAPTRAPAAAAVGATTSRLPVHQPRSGRDASGSTGARRTPPSTAPSRVAGDEHDRARGRRRGRRASSPAKRPCSSTNTRAPQRAGGRRRRRRRPSIAGASAIGDRRGAGGGRGRRGARRPRSVRARGRSRIDTDLSPPPRTARSTRRTPRSRRPGRRRACRRPRGRRRPGAVTSASSSGIGRGVAVGDGEGARHRAEGHDERVDAAVDELGRAGDQLVGVLAEADEQVGRDAGSRPKTRTPRPRPPVLGQRDGRLARHPARGARRRRATRRGCRWRSAPASRSSCERAAEVAGRLALHLDRQAGHRRPDRPDAAGQVAGAAVAAVAVVPVVSTICRTPSRRTAASATSASCVGRLHRGRGAGAQRLPRWRRTGSGRARRSGCRSGRPSWPARRRRAAGRSARRARRRRSSGRRTRGGRPAPRRPGR